MYGNEPDFLHPDRMNRAIVGVLLMIPWLGVEIDPLMDSLRIALGALGAVTALCWLLSVVTKEYGWIDRLWSVAPVGYAIYFLVEGRFGLRVAVMTVLVALWGARLTYNFWRKGGYRLGGEDYRWKHIRKGMRDWQWALFNIVWVAGLQNAILLALVLPQWLAARPDAAPWGILDWVASGLFLLCLIGETVADEQQWRFQEAKRKRKERGEPIERGFLTTGLFRYSRHPNFFFEMGLWWAFYLFSIASGASWLNLTIAGVAVLTLQFQGSTPLTEKLSLAKYPDYAEYQRKTWRLIPGPPRR